MRLKKFLLNLIKRGRIGMRRAGQSRDSAELPCTALSLAAPVGRWQRNGVNILQAIEDPVLKSFV